MEMIIFACTCLSGEKDLCFASEGTVSDRMECAERTTSTAASCPTSVDSATLGGPFPFTADCEPCEDWLRAVAGGGSVLS